MKIRVHTTFKKKYQKLSHKRREKFRERRNIFMENPTHPLLRTHPLKGKWSGYYSFSVTGDLRTIYRHIDDETVLLVDIDTHSNLYS